MRVSPEHFDRLAAHLPDMGRDPAAIRQRIETMEYLLERSFTIPGLNRKIGMDGLLGLIPVIGDIATAAMGTWIVWEARNLGMSKLKLLRMMGNIGFDTAIGAIPLVGDLFDIAFRSNSRNLRIIRRHLDKHHPATVTVDAVPR
jgi:hypothetical protein